VLAHLIRSKGLANLLRRGLAIVGRTGFTARRMKRALRDFAGLLDRFDAGGTFPVTATALVRHPAAFRDLLTLAPAVELAVHGHRHTDLQLLSPAEQRAEVEHALSLFRAFGIPFTGFRAPYLRWDDSLMAVLEAAGLWYDSSQSILWPVIEDAGLSSSTSECLQRLCDFCRPRPAGTHVSLPFWLNDLLEIPVSLPDDEMLVERLHVRDVEQTAAIWTDILERCQARGELFVLQLHPERFPLCATALERVLERARSLQPAVWLANLRDIAVWWQEKRSFRVDLVSQDEGRWEVTAEGPERGVLLVRGAEPTAHSVVWRHGYRMVSERRFAVSAGPCPCIGLPAQAPLELLHFLTDLGYVVEVSDRSQDYAVYLNRSSFAPEDALPLLSEIEADPAPLVRWACWPHGAGSALAVTGDVDALTVWDYAIRPFEQQVPESG
jgi:peptidoglycan/xylan/chitin deacetylase (PgdA/CDA1 family)